MQSLGIDPKLDFSNLPKIVKAVEEASGIDVHQRHPYAGQLAFTAFSGSHQDAIRKGFEKQEEARKLFGMGWKMPYLHIDPADVGRTYEKLIRINSQSGKGGIVYVLEHDFGLHPPKNMHPAIGAAVQRYTDRKGDEIDASELIKVFREEFIEVKGPLELIRYARVPGDETADTVQVRLTILVDGREMTVSGSGNGPISATVHAIRNSAGLYDFILEDFSERTLGGTADAKAIAYVGIRRKRDNALFYGAGEHSNIDQAAILALLTALNKAMNDDKKSSGAK